MNLTYLWIEMTTRQYITVQVQELCPEIETLFLTRVINVELGKLPHLTSLTLDECSINITEVHDICICFFVCAFMCVCLHVLISFHTRSLIHCRNYNIWG